MTNSDRQALWAYVDASDVLCIVENLLVNIPQHAVSTAASKKWEEGYQEALDDIRHAASLDSHLFSLNAVRQHIEAWQGHVALNSSDEGYVQAIEDVVESLSQLISDRY